jgi:hypothetical protein
MCEGIMGASMSIPSRALVFVLAAALALPAHAAPGEADREGVADEAAAHLDRGEFRDAAQDFAAYYRLLGDKRATTVGENSVLIAIDAYWRAWESGRDLADLHAARDLLVEHLDAVERHTGARAGKAADRAAIELLKVEATLLEAEPADPEPAAPPPATEPSVGPTPEPKEPSPPAAEPARVAALDPEPPRDRAAPRRDVAGIGLVAGGSVALAGGVTLLAIGGTLVPRGRRQFDACDDCDESLRSDYLDDVRAASRPYLIAGGIAAGVGVGLLAWGIVRLVRRKRHDTAAARRWMPIPGGLAMMPVDRDPPAR